MNSKNNISNFEDDDLNEMAPRLSKSGRKSPFKADDYFDSFAENIENRISELEEIKKEAPILSNIPLYNPFEVPSAYFDELPTRIQNVVSSKKPPSSILDWFILLIKPNFAIPVLTTLLIAFAGISYLEKQGKSTNTAAEYQLSEDDQLEMIDESTIIDAIVSITGPESDKKTEENIGIENFLIENNIDESNLNTEL